MVCGVGVSGATLWFSSRATERFLMQKPRSPLLKITVQMSSHGANDDERALRLDDEVRSTSALKSESGLAPGAVPSVAEAGMD